MVVMIRFLLMTTLPLAELDTVLPMKPPEVEPAERSLTTAEQMFFSATAG